MIFSEIIKAIKEAKKIVVLPHLNADGDALGSSLGLLMAIKDMGKNAVIVVDEPVPGNYSFLPGIDNVIVYSEECFSMSEYDGVDLAIALDTGDVGRLGKRKGIFDKAGFTVNIDHHNTNTMFANVNFVNTDSSATGEIIYQIVKLLGNTKCNALDSKLALCLYTAISSDTGGFRYSNTTATTHQIAADLVNNGVDVADVSRRLFDLIPLGKAKLMGLVIQSLKILENGKIAVMVVNDLMLNETGAREEDCEGIVNIGRNIEGVEVALLFRKKSDDTIKVNLRSNSDIDVSKIAVAFSGGGHKKAAGCTLKGNFSEVEEKIISEIKRMIK